MKTTRQWAVLLALGASAAAWGMGPVVGGGAVYTMVETANGTVTFSHLVGPSARVGFELGDRFNNEFSFQWSQASGTGTQSGLTLPIQVRTLAGRYTFTVDFLTKKGLAALPGFTPFLGVGLAAGTVHIQVDTVEKDAFYLEFHAVVGARYTFANGLGLRAEVALSTYGGFSALQPTLAVSYRFLPF